MGTKKKTMNSKINKKLSLNICSVIAGVAIYESVIKSLLPQKEQIVKDDYLTGKQMLLKAAQLPLSFSAYNRIVKILEEEWYGDKKASDEGGL